MDTSDTEEMLQAVDWENLLLPGGISHGYTQTGDLIPYAWDAFGGESWLVEVVYASVTGQVAPIRYPSPPTANGSGFIDELTWLYLPPPPEQDHWGTDWESYLTAAAENQRSYFTKNFPQSCYSQLGLFGLSAGEIPDPSSVPQEQMYQPFGVGGQFASENDGTKLLGSPVIVPHYSAMIASLQPEDAIKMWDWLMTHGYFSPLNNVESLQFIDNSGCDSSSVIWNQLKGSWNLSLQTLGWGNYLVKSKGEVSVLWEAAVDNSFLKQGYDILMEN
jgi:hypothetical protein